MNKEIVPYEEALALSQIGFVQSCWHAYHDLTWPSKEDKHKLETVHNLTSYTEPYAHKYINPVLAPTFSQAFRWFREKYDLDYYIYRNDDDLINYVKNKGVVDLFKYRCGYSDSTSHPIKGCYTHEEAELECLKKLIEIVKEKQNEQQ